MKKREGSYHHGHLREALLEAAEKHVARTRAVSLTLREVATSAGVSHTAAYRHFDDKTALLAEVARRGFERLSARLVDARVTARTNTSEAEREELLALGEAYVAFALHEPGLFRVMWHDEVKPFTSHAGLAEAARAALDLLVMALARAHERGTLAPGLDAKTAAMIAWSTMHGHAVLALDGQLVGPFGVTDATHSVRLVLRTLLEGLYRPSSPAFTPRKKG